VGKAFVVSAALVTFGLFGAMTQHKYRLLADKVKVVSNQPGFELKVIGLLMQRLR
jgi:hypothetical protein